MATSTRAVRRSRRSSTIRARAEHASVGRGSRVGKVRKAFWLDPRLLDEAREALGASTERQAVEMALDLVGFRRDLRRGAQALRGLTLSRLD